MLPRRGWQGRGCRPPTAWTTATRQRSWIRQIRVADWVWRTHPTMHETSVRSRTIRQRAQRMDRAPGRRLVS
jgi:hypothetical protein